MSTVARSILDTLVRGLFLLLPLMVLGILAAKALRTLHALVEPVAGRLGSIGGVPMPNLLALVALVLIVYLAGLLSRAPGSGRLIRWLESTVLAHIPGYAYMKGMGETVAGVEGGPRYEPVLARIEEAWQIGFIVETIEPGQYAVYVPGAPNPWSGAVYFMAEDRIRRVDVKIGEVQGCLKRIGLGSGELLRGKL